MNLVHIVVSLLPVPLFFVFYFRNFVFTKSIIWQSKCFFYGLLCSIVAIVIQWPLPEVESTAVKAFLYAAFIEESIRFIVLYLRARYGSENFSITEGIFDGILIGLGFSFAENLNFSVSVASSTILVRNISAVPLHVFVSGIMGYYISRRSLVTESKDRKFFKSRRFRMLFLAMLVPFVIHGFYDYALFIGGNMHYFIPILLIFSYGYLEYLILRARVIPGGNLLNVLGLDADDLEIIEKQKHYDHWIDDFQIMVEQRISLFVNRWSLWSTIVGVLLLILPVALFVSENFFQSSILLVPELTKDARLALLYIFPITIGLMLVALDKLNYFFLREHLMRMPRGVTVNLRYGHEESLAMSYDISTAGIFLRGSEVPAVGEQCSLTIENKQGDRPIEAWGTVRWVNRNTPRLPIGALIELDKFHMDFILLRAKYSFFKLMKILKFNLWEGRSPDHSE